MKYYVVAFDWVGTRAEVVHLARANDRLECWEMARRGLEYLRRKSPGKSFEYMEMTMELVEMPEVHNAN